MGLQLFTVFIAVLTILKLLKEEEISWKKILQFVLIFLFSGGLWVIFIWGAQGPKVGNIHLFFDIVEFRIAHHFFPAYFPKTHVIFIASIVLFSSIYWYKKNIKLFWFFIIAEIGILIYCIGIHFKLELFLSTQWMKITIWLKFMSIITIVSGLQSIFEIKYQRLIFIVGFILALILSLIRFNPKYDKKQATSLYSWITENTTKQDIFLVPPSLGDFKYRTKRNSYFDFKAMLHHRPDIYAWAERFEQVYGLNIKERNVQDDIFGKVRNAYAQGSIIDDKSDIDYYIIPNNEHYLPVIDKFESRSSEPVYIDNEFIIYGQKEKQN